MPHLFDPSFSSGGASLLLSGTIEEAAANSDVPVNVTTETETESVVGGVTQSQPQQDIDEQPDNVTTETETESVVSGASQSQPQHASEDMSFGEWPEGPQRAETVEGEVGGNVSPDVEAAFIDILRQNHEADR